MARQYITPWGFVANEQGTRQYITPWGVVANEQIVGGIAPSGIVSIEAFGTAKLSGQVAPSGVASGEQWSSLEAAHFNYPSDYLTRGANLSGIADGKKGTLSFWLRPAGSTGQRIFQGSRHNLHFQTNGKLLLTLQNAAAATVVQWETTALTLGQLYHVLFSWDAGTDVQCYIDGAANGSALANNNDTISYTTGTAFNVGANVSSGEVFNGDLAEFWYSTTEYLDLTDAANREFFRLATGAAADLGSDGSTPTGTSPIVYLSGPIATWHTNDGTGGGFTELGALTEAVGPQYRAHDVGGVLAPVAISSVETFGSASAGGQVAPSGLASAESIGSHTLSGGAAIVATGIATGEAFGTTSLGIVIQPGGIASAEAFGGASLGGDIAASGIGTGEAFGGVQLDGYIFGAGIASAEAVGAASLSGADSILPSGITSAEAFGTAKLNATIAPSGIVSLEAFGTASLAIHIGPSGIASVEAFGSTAIGGSIAPNGVASLEAFGSATLTLENQILPSGIGSAEAFGTPSIGVQIAVTGIGSGEVVGTPIVAAVIAPTTPGLEFELLKRRTHYTLNVRRVHWTLESKDRD